MSWLLVDALCECSANDLDAATEDAWGALLAGQALVETVNLTQIKPRYQRTRTRIQEWLVAILTEQLPLDSQFPATERALAGNILAQLGDPRPGVGVGEDGLPDIT